MKTPRLSGAALRAVRVLSDNPVAARALRSAALRDYGLNALLALPREARPLFDVEPRPLQAAPPRTWDDAARETPPIPPTRQSSAQLVGAFRAQRTTPTEVLERLAAHLATDSHGAATHSPFVALDLDVARRAAAESTLRYREGRPLGPLDGVPVPLKDQHDVVGLPTRCGTAYRETVAQGDAVLVTSLRRAGAVLFGKTHLTEWGMTPTGHNPHFLMPRNAYRSDRAAGGSSTGSAVATALGYCTVASGSDGGGSIRVPAALNGVFGLKPSFLRISRGGDALGGTVGHTGPLGQSCADLVDFLEVTASQVDRDDPVTGYAPDLPGATTAWRRALGRGVRGCRIGVPHREWADASPRIVDAGMAALRALEKAGGARLVDLELPSAQHALGIGVLTIGGEALANLTDDLREQGARMSDDLRVTLNIVRRVSAEEYLVAQKSRAWLRRQMAEALRKVDVLALPSTARVAPAYTLAEDRVHVQDTEALIGLCRYAFLANLTGLPAGSAPVGMEEGLPVGVQIIGDAWDEASVLAVMAELERVGVTQLPPPEGRFDLLGRG